MIKSSHNIPKILKCHIKILVFVFFSDVASLIFNFHILIFKLPEVDDVANCKCKILKIESS